jgi:hypothetical protein
MKLFGQIAAGLFCLLAPAQLLGATDSVRVAVFDDPRYMDTSGSVSAESDNVQASMSSLGFSVSTFTNIVAAVSTNAVISRIRASFARAFTLGFFYIRNFCKAIAKNSQHYPLTISARLR